MSEVDEPTILVKFEKGAWTTRRWIELTERQKFDLMDASNLSDDDDQLPALYEQTVAGLESYFHSIIHINGLTEVLREDDIIRKSVKSYFSAVHKLSTIYEQSNPLERFLVESLFWDTNVDEMNVSAFMEACRLVSEHGLAGYRPRRKKGGQPKDPRLNEFADELVENWCVVTHRELVWSDVKGRIGAFLDSVLALVNLEMTMVWGTTSGSAPEGIAGEMIELRRVPLRLQRHHTEIRRATERAVKRRRAAFSGNEPT